MLYPDRFGHSRKHASRVRRFAFVLVGLCLFWSPASNSDVDFAYRNYYSTGVITLCTGTCDSFASLALGSEIRSSFYVIETTENAPWTFADIAYFEFEILNPAAPIEPFDGTNPTTANPLPINELIAPVRAAGGGLTTGGTTDAAQDLVSGSILHEFVVPPFNNNGAWVITDIIGALGVMKTQVCLFFPTAGCIPGATRAVVADGQFNYLGPDSDGDGLTDEFDPDDDNDRIRDLLDTEPFIASNTCTTRNGDNATFMATVMEDVSCAAKASIDVEAGTFVLPPAGHLRLISSSTGFQSGIEIGEQMTVISGDPCAGCSLCGNGIVEPPEQCDDGNTIGGDGCRAICLFE